ncbi:MAG: hypothetical protein ACE5HV_15870 [Acidobacteriota bacterium]
MSTNAEVASETLDVAPEAPAQLNLFTGWPTSTTFPHQRQLDFPIATGS